MFYDMELWNSIRQRVLRDGVSIRQIQRETGLHFKTIKKILSQSCPPLFTTTPRRHVYFFIDRVDGRAVAFARYLLLWSGGRRLGEMAEAQALA